MQRLIQKGNSAVKEANRLFKDEKKFDQSKNAYESAKTAFNGALEIAEKRDFAADQKEIKESLASIETSIEAALLSKGDSMLTSAEGALKADKFAEAERQFAGAIEFLKRLDIQRDEKSEMVKQGANGRIRAMIEQGRTKMRTADQLFKDVKYIEAQAGYKEAREYLKGVMKAATDYEISKLVRKLDSLIQRCTRNISAATAAPMKGVGEVKTPEFTPVGKTKRGDAKFEKSGSDPPLTEELRIMRTVYDPVTKDFVPEKKLDYPEVKRWIEAHPPPDYWYILRIDNRGAPVDEWAVEIETNLALSVKEAYIEGIDRRFDDDLTSEHDRYKERYSLSVQSGYGSPLHRNGTRRLYFRLNIDCEKTLLPVYALSGRVIAGDDVVDIAEKEFPFSCELRELKKVWANSPNEVLGYAHERAREHYPMDTATAIVDALRLYNEINDLVKSRYVEESLLKNKIENLRESLKNVKALTGVGRPLELVEEILDDILPRAEVYVTLDRWKAMNLFDVMMTELLGVRS